MLAPTPDFDSIPDWLKVGLTAAGTLFATLVATLKIVKEPIMQEMNGLGQRLNATEISVGQHETALDKLESASAIAQAERRQLFEKIGEITSSVEKYAQAMTRHDSELNKTLQDLRVLVGKIETKVDILITKEP